jgi:hypothetical protein
VFDEEFLIGQEFEVVEHDDDESVTHIRVRFFGSLAVGLLVNPEDLPGYLLPHLVGGRRPPSLVGPLGICGALDIFGTIRNRNHPLGWDCWISTLHSPARHGLASDRLLIGRPGVTRATATRRLQHLYVPAAVPINQRDELVNPMRGPKGSSLVRSGVAFEFSTA